jgi:hypothetical protein
MESSLRLAAEQDIGLSTMTASLKLYLAPFQALTVLPIEEKNHDEIARYVGSALFLTPHVVAIAEHLSPELKRKIVICVRKQGNLFVAYRLAWALGDRLPGKSVSPKLNGVSLVLQFAVSLLWAFEEYSIEWKRREEDKAADTLSATIGIFFLVKYLRNKRSYLERSDSALNEVDFKFFEDAGVLKEFALSPELSFEENASRNFLEVDEDFENPALLWESFQADPRRTPNPTLKKGMVTVVVDLDETLVHVESRFFCYYLFRLTFLFKEVEAVDANGNVVGTSNVVHQRDHAVAKLEALKRSGARICVYSAGTKSHVLSALQHFPEGFFDFIGT